MKWSKQYLNPKKYSMTHNLQVNLSSVSNTTKRNEFIMLFVYKFNILPSPVY